MKSDLRDPSGQNVFVFIFYWYVYLLFMRILESYEDTAVTSLCSSSGLDRDFKDNRMSHAVNTVWRTWHSGVAKTTTRIYLLLADLVTTFKGFDTVDCVFSVCQLES